MEVSFVIGVEEQNEGGGGSSKMEMGFLRRWEGFFKDGGFTEDPPIFEKPPPIFVLRPEDRRTPHLRSSEPKIASYIASGSVVKAFVFERPFLVVIEMFM